LDLQIRVSYIIRIGKALIISLCIGVLWLISPSRLAAQNPEAGALVTPRLTAAPIRSKGGDGGIEWRALLTESATLLAVEHIFRIVQDPKIHYGDGVYTNGLRGPFFGDWIRCVRNVRGWGDGDKALTNYLGHPMRGAITGFMEVHHDPRYRAVVFGRSSRYWVSRMRAMVFSAAYHSQFELGPISEASIGNIHLNPRKRGVVDIVVTPTVGTAWMVGEDIADRYLIRAIEGRTDNAVVLGIVRSLLNPSRSMSNLVGLRRPWERDSRAGITVDPGHHRARGFLPN